MSTCKIVQLTVSNVKKLKAVRIRPDGNVVTIGGRNAQGKSSVLDSIMYALAGKRAMPTQPIRRGETAADVTLDLGTMIVHRHMDVVESRDTLIVTSKDGAQRYTKPQAMLDRMYDDIAFDPLAFTRMKPRELAEQVRLALGLDFTALDERRAKLFADRTDVNRDAKRLESQVAGVRHHPDAPDEQVSVAALAEELRRRQLVNRDNAQRRGELLIAENGAVLIRQSVDRIAFEIAKLTKMRAEAEAQHLHTRTELDEAREKCKTKAMKVAKLVDLDESEITAQMADAERVNAMVRANLQRLSLDVEQKHLARTADELTRDLEAIDAEKQRQLAAAKFPIPGLTFTADGVMLNGLPFDQAASSEQMKVSAAIGAAQNPELRVMLIRDASLLDAESRAYMPTLAKEMDMDFWLEVVSEDGEGCSVFIEDGEASVPVPAGVGAG
ncbi:MAG: AAA family ATPase [Candidatus Binatia bacterium]|nr:AAA family ATPase [Candidatus Binatia bacterium]